MPSRACKHPCCENYVQPPAEYCELHKYDRPARAEAHKHYDQHRRNKESKRFYNSKEWQRARTTALTADPVCSRCRIKFADTVHHLIPITSATNVQKIDQRLLMPLCAGCHSETEREIAAEAEGDHGANRDG